MNSYRNFSPSPRNGWIIAWMNNYSVRFLHQREWDKVTHPPFTPSLSIYPPDQASIETKRPTDQFVSWQKSIATSNFRRLHSRKKRRNKQRKKEILLLREKEKKNDDRADSFAFLDNRPSQELTPHPPTFTSIPRICPRITAFRYLVAPPDYINFISDEPWMNGYRSGIPTRAPPVLSRACNTG